MFCCCFVERNYSGRQKVMIERIRVDLDRTLNIFKKSSGRLQLLFKIICTQNSSCIISILGLKAFF